MFFSNSLSNSLKYSIFVLSLFLSGLTVAAVIQKTAVKALALEPLSTDEKAFILDQLGQAQETDYNSDEVIVKYQSYIANFAGVDEPTQVLTRSGIIFSKQEPLVTDEVLPSLQNVYLVQGLQGQDIARVVRKLLNNPDVIYAEPNYFAKAWYTPNDPKFSSQWALRPPTPGVNAEKAWDLWKGDGQTIVAVVDEGVDESHSDLTNQIATGSDGNTCGPHGTMVAGMVSAETDNNVGVAAIGFNLKILNKNACDLSYSSIAKKISQSVSAGAKVINMSLGGSQTSPTLSNAVKGAWNAGVIIAASAGNCGEGCPSSNCGGALNPTIYPAAYPEVIGVAAIDSSGSRACFSSKGNLVELTAPGHHVWSTKRGGSYTQWSGTSASSPVVAGVAGLLYSLPKFSTRNNANAQAIRNILKQTAFDLGTSGYDIENGYGLVDAYAALQAAGGALTPGPTPTLSLPTATPNPSISLSPSATPSVSSSPTSAPALCSSADTNNDGKVNQKDVSELINNWGGSGGSHDVNSDGIVNGVDLGIIFTCWTG